MLSTGHESVLQCTTWKDTLCYVGLPLNPVVCCVQVYCTPVYSSNVYSRLCRFATQFCCVLGAGCVSVLKYTILICTLGSVGLLHNPVVCCVMGVLY